MTAPAAAQGPTLFSAFPGFQTRALQATADEVLWGGGKGSSKGLDLQTALPTPHGWTTMGKVKVGDALFDERGEICHVTYVTPIHHRSCYRITFDDGTIIVADDVHQWSVLGQRARANQEKNKAVARATRRAGRPSRSTSGGKYDWLCERNRKKAAEVRAGLPESTPWTGAEIKDTRELAAYLETQPHTKHAIPCALPLSLPEVPLPLDPYVLGAWVGDGDSGSSGFTCDYRRPWVVEQIRQRGWIVTKGKATHRYWIKGLNPTLREMCVLGNKRIPKNYLRAGIQQRRALLSGLMDTDGMVDREGESSLSTSKANLAADYLELIHSLGYKPSLHARLNKCQTGAICPSFLITWMAFDSPVTDPKKAIRLRARTNIRARRRFVVSVEPIGKGHTKCISVDSPSNLYLAGSGMVPTHNTQIIVVKPIYQIDKSAYKALVLRHSFPELKELLDRMHSMYPKLPAHQRPQWKGDLERWEFPSGAKIQVGFCHKREHVQRYQGQEWADILFDEIGNLADEGVIDMLLAEQRCPDPTVRRQFCSTANPGGAGHAFLRRRFVIPCGKQGQRVVYVNRALPNGDIATVTRQFVPGTVLDNPVYANDPRYMARLYALPTRLRRCLLEGDWDAATGAAFDELDPVHFVAPFNPPAHWPYIAAMDWGFTHWCVFMWGRVSEDGRVYVMDTLRWRFLPDWDLAEAILEMVPPQALKTVHAGHDLWGHAGSRGGSRDNTPTQAQYFRGKGIGVVQANIKRVAGYQNLMQYLGWRETDYVERRTPMLLFADTPGNRWLHDDHLPSLVVDPTNPADVLKVNADPETGEGGDDGYDCARMLLASRPFKASSALPLKFTSSSDFVLRREGEKVYRPDLTEPDSARRPSALPGEQPYLGA